MWIEYILIASADYVPHIFQELIHLSGDGPPRTEIIVVEPKQDLDVWQIMVSHLQRLTFRGAPNRTSVQIATVLAGKLGPLLVGCEVRGLHGKFYYVVLMPFNLRTPLYQCNFSGIPSWILAIRYASPCRFFDASTPFIRPMEVYRLSLHQPHVQSSSWPSKIKFAIDRLLGR